MTKCPSCGAPVDGSQGTCPECNASLEGSTQSFAPVGSIDETTVNEVPRTESPVLVVRKGHDTGEKFYIDRTRLTLGRDPRADVFLNDVTVSRNHAVVTTAGSEVSIEDVGSLNGIYVNGVNVDKAILHDGDRVQIGTFQMVFLTGKDQ
ncbi:MAG: FHA domain-containing protein [Coriobacteriia bacterium]